MSSHDIAVNVPASDRRKEADKRAAIIRAANEAFLSEGYAATSMATILARVGGSKATLYNHFPSKEALFAAVIESKCEELLSFVYAAKLDGGDIRGVLTGLATRMLRFGLSDEAIAAYRLVAAESVRFPEIGRLVNETCYGKGIAELAQYFESAMASCKLRRADPILAAEQFFELCNGGVFHRRLWNVVPMPPHREIEARAAAAVDTFFRAYGA